MAAKAPAVAEKPAPPALADLPPMYNRPVEAYDGDQAIPKVYTLYEQSGIVESGAARSGDIVLALNREDFNPTILIREDTDTFQAFILDSERYVTKGRSGERWQRLANDYVRDRNNPDDADVSIGYRYPIAITGMDFPFASMLLTRTAGRAAFQSINHALNAAAMAGQAFPVLVEFSRIRAVGQESGKGYWKMVPKPFPAETTPPELIEWVMPFVREYRAAYANRIPDEQPDRPQIAAPGASFD